MHGSYGCPSSWLYEIVKAPNAAHDQIMCLIKILVHEVAQCQHNLYDMNYSQSANMLLTQWYAMVAVKY